MTILKNTSNLVSIDVETTGVSRDDELFSAAVAWLDESGAISSKSFYLNQFDQDSSKDDIEFKQVLFRCLFDSSFNGTVIFHNLDFDIKFLLRRYWTEHPFQTQCLCRVADTLTISRVSRNNKYLSHIDPQGLKCHSLKFLAKEHLELNPTTFQDATFDQNIRFADRASVLKYNELDAVITLKLYLHFKESLTKEEWYYLEHVEFPQLLNIVHMNWAGVPYNLLAAVELKKNILEYIDTLENELFENLGGSFNLSSQKELISAIFYNHNLSFLNMEGRSELIQPLYLTNKGQPKVDLETLKELKLRISRQRSNQNTVNTLNKIMLHIELSKALSFVENHISYARPVNGNYRLYPNFSAEAKSGRLISSKPSLLNVPKAIFKKSEISNIPQTLKDSNGKSRSVRWLIEAPEGYSICSIDINALDLTVITNGAMKLNDKFLWIEFFKKQNGHSIDTHMAVSREIDREGFEAILGPLLNKLPEGHDSYWLLKPGTKSLGFIHKDTGELTEIQYPDDFCLTATTIDRNRKKSKEVNLSTGYMIGANKLAIRLTRETEILTSETEARAMLEGFYNAFPEIRSLQDEISNKIYVQGFVQSEFGRKYFADVFDDLNEMYHRSNGDYEFICVFDQNHFYIKACQWIKSPLPAIQNMKVIEKPSGLLFDTITHIEEIDRYSFRKTTRRKTKSKFNKKSERNMEETSDFELNRIQLTNDIDKQLSLGQSFSTNSEHLLLNLVKDGHYFIPEKNILFYRVHSENPSSKYFKRYKRLESVIRKFFPMYCQGIAATVASLSLTQVREKIEADKLDAQILLFIHDQMDVMVNTDIFGSVREILTNAIESPKRPFKIPLSGKVEPPSKHIT